MVLSAAFLMTALSRGIVFAEIVPTELINRSVHFVRTFKRRSRPFIPTSSSAETSITTSVVSLANVYGEQLGFGYLRYVVLFAILFISMAVGIGLTVHNGGNSSYLRTAFTAFTSWRVTGSSCH
jgi:hypothetical protein